MRKVTKVGFITHGYNHTACNSAVRIRNFSFSSPWGIMIYTQNHNLIQLEYLVSDKIYSKLINPKIINKRKLRI